MDSDRAMKRPRTDVKAADAIPLGTLQACFLRLDIAVEVEGMAPKDWPWGPKTKLGKGAGERRVGDYIPDDRWPCCSPPSIDLDSDPGRLEEALSDEDGAVILNTASINQSYF
jgi:hypothetical protein